MHYLLILLVIGLILQITGLLLAVKYAIEKKIEISKIYFNIMKLGEMATMLSAGLLIVNMIFVIIKMF